MLAHDVLPFVQDNRVHVVPPCVITEDDARAGLAVIDAVLGEVADKAIDR
jgi:taurine--2-oxoglutarate transaminase